ncbi:hypothetical protein BCR39DRAFT_551334 [Naematelia encephala]|uniref:Topoisomerase I damage affected protein 2 n=1 Tax=Naematelia encephala TaxID=71784 RepID=A0A1Y2AJ22_9TREE|nr:hypothetical protein BCR39DRAFT_551334 [Naematelia encephala]
MAQATSSRSRLPGIISTTPNNNNNNNNNTPASRSSASSPGRHKFPSDQLRPYMKTVLSRTLTGAAWDPSDRPRMSGYSKEISDKVKQRMIDIEPRGFKYIVTTTLSENLGQAGRADMSCHWEDTDTAIQEMFSNESIILVCVAFAVRVI